MIPVDEDRILLPRDPAISDSNDWLTFSLRKVNVVSEEGDRPVSLLAANSAFPVKVSGVLQRIDSNLNHLGTLFFLALSSIQLIAKIAKPSRF